MRAAGSESLGRLLVARLEAVWETGRPITVQDLVDTLIPYPHVRSALGLTMKGEYDLGILRLLRDGEHLSVDAELAQAVERELAMPEPGLGFLSDVTRTGVEVRPEAWARWAAGSTPEALESGTGPPPPVAHSPPRASHGAPLDRIRDRPMLRREHSSARARHPSGSDPATGEGRATAERCRHCQRTLPERTDLQFCPYCGAGQADPACADCQEPLERGWAYCPRCGKATEK